jgi:hypothetical protein
MANDCWNSVTISGDIDTIKKIETKFNSFDGNPLNYKNYHKLFDTDVTDVQDEDWGPKWFTSSVEMIDDKLIIKGDSAWMPTIPLFELISEEYEVDCELIYEETGMDFAGVIKWEKGDLVYEQEYTYWEYKYVTDTEEFYNEAEYSVVCYDSVEEWVSGLNLEKWKQSPDIDMNRLNEAWQK